MPKKGPWRRIGLAAFVLTAGTGAFAFATNRAVLGSAEGRVYTDLGRIPAEPVALVLGTTPFARGGRNPFFERRMEAAAALYRAGKVRKLLVSGDNGTRYYDEPTAMRKALVSRGVSPNDIVLDYAGFRTLDSVVRAHTVFGLDRCTIVTDDFHLPRALYIARERGLDAVGFQTRHLPVSVSPWTYTREVAARTLVWLDIHLLNRQPKFDGPPQPIRVAVR